MRALEPRRGPRGSSTVVARISRYRFQPERLGVVGGEVRAAVHANPHGYDPRLQAGFLFFDRASGEAVALTVSEEPAVLNLAPAEPPGALPQEVEDYEVVALAASPPREGASLFADFCAMSLDELAARSPTLDDRVRAEFLLAGPQPGEALAVTITEDARQHEMEYFFFRDSLYS